MKNKEERCETGCIHVTGGEIRHHRDCIFYPGSYTEMFDNLVKENEKLKKIIKRLKQNRKKSRF